MATESPVDTSQVARSFGDGLRPGGSRIAPSWRPFEAFSKAAVVASVGLILGLEIVVVPGLPWWVRTLLALALVGGWVAGRLATTISVAILLVLGPVLPVLFARLGSGPDLSHSAIWLAGLAGYALSGVHTTRWALPRPWKVLLGGWALTLSLGWPVIVARETGFNLAAFGDTGGLTSWAFLTVPTTIAWVLHVVLAQLVALLWLERLLSCDADARPRVLRLAVHGLWIGATVSSLVAIVQGAIDLDFLSLPEWTSLGRAPGTMLDANGYGVIAALAGPLAVWVLTSDTTRRRSMLALGVFVINGVGLWMSGSRTAFACAIIATLALGFGLLRAHRVAAWRLGAIAATLAAAVVILTLVSAHGPLRREDNAQLKGRDVVAVARTLWNRGGYGQIAQTMVREHPVVGVGVGSYNWLAPNYWRLLRNERLPFDNAQNWWRQQLAEFGVVGSLPVLVWSALIAWLVIVPTGPRAWTLEGLVVRGALLGIGVISLLGMPTQNPVVLIWFFTLVGLLAATLDDDAHPVTPGPASRAAWVGVTLLSVGYASGQVVLARGALSPVIRAQRVGLDHESGTYAPEPLESGGTFRWTRKNASFVLRDTQPWLIVEAWVQHPDAQTRPVEVRIESPCQTIFDRRLDGHAHVLIALQRQDPGLPVRLSMHVSRTWRPSSYGSADPRTLGAAVAMNFAPSLPDSVPASDVVPLRVCGGPMVD